MKAFCFLFLLASALALPARASWYWPFGDDEKGEPRLSELMEKASMLIDDAGDLAADGKTDDAVAKYREALEELDRVEAENPERAATPEFASLRNKRAYVSAAIDSMLMADAKEHAIAVAVSDTTELEKRFAELRARQKRERAAARASGEPALADPRKAVPEAEDQLDEFVKVERERNRKVRETAGRARAKRLRFERLRDEVEEDPDRREARLALIGEYVARAEYAKAGEHVAYLLGENPDDAAALNLRAACEALTGDTAAAERTLNRVIETSPRDYHAYYNMANLRLQTDEDAAAARLYYETGRKFGGPADAALEEALK